VNIPGATVTCNDDYCFTMTTCANSGIILANMPIFTIGLYNSSAPGGMDNYTFSPNELLMDVKDPVSG